MSRHCGHSAGWSQLRRRAGGDGEIDDPIWPTGMRRRTFEQKVARIEAAEEKVDEHLVYFMAKLLRY
jgi:hypothetical protein